jgi:hypothetical protein
MSKLESKLQFGTKPVNRDVFYSNGLDESASKIVAERRAYAIFRSTGKGQCNATKAVIESGGVRTQPYENILSGPRLVPPPSLTSVDWSSDGANDIYDAFLWKATVSFTCYSPEQFNSFDRGFFQHMNDVELELGWINGEKPITIRGKIVDFQFSVNEKLHYDCSVTFAGAAIEAAAAFDLNLKTPNDKYSVTTSTKGPVFPQSIVGFLKAQSILKFKDKKLAAGDADGDGSFGVANFNTNDTSWLFWQKQKLVYYVSLSKLIETINDNLVKTNGFEGIFKNIKSIALATTITTKIKSANPISVLNQGSRGVSANYAEGANFGWDGSGVMYFISFDTLEKIEKELIDDKSDNPHPTKNTLIQFIKRVLDEINSCLGESIKLEMIPYGQSGESTKHGYEIVDRKTIIKKINATDVNPLDKTAKIRNISVQSTIDSEIAAIALSSAQSGKGLGMVQGVFGCKPALPNISKDQQELANMYASFAELDETILSDCIQTLKKICNFKIPQQIGYKYGVTITLTVDGYSEYLFGQTFRVEGLPSMLTKANVYFIVLKQGHKFSNGDWTMDLEGQMMFDISDGAKPIPGIDPTDGKRPILTEDQSEEAAPAAGGIFNSF